MAKSSSGSAAAVKLDTSPPPVRAAPAPRSGNGVLELDRLIHEPVRMGIVSALAANPTLTFNDLKKLLDTTDGNLSVHARKLEEAGYVKCSKSFEGRMPKTEYRLTEEGSRALTKYVDHLDALVQSIRGRQQ